MDRAWEIHEQWLQERFDHLGDVKIHQWNPSGVDLKFGAVQVGKFLPELLIQQAPHLDQENCNFRTTAILLLRILYTTPDVFQLDSHCIPVQW